MQSSLLPIMRDPGKYHRSVSLGFGVWLDDATRPQRFHGLPGPLLNKSRL
jgi:hypothetical protein